MESMEIKSKWRPREKSVETDALVAILAPLRRQGRQIVFTNGCFDLMHAGHVRYLQTARAQGDILVVGLNSDRSVRGIKDRGRPINTQSRRMEVLVALECVDYVVVFDSPDPYALIEALAPDVLVKGADWAEKEIVGADIVKSAGGRVFRAPLLEGISTTAIIERIIDRYGS